MSEGLRGLIEGYLRGCEGWREHPEHAGTYLQWEDLSNPGLDRLPTDLAAMRQLVTEGLAARRR